MSGTTQSHRPVPTRPQPATPRRAKQPSIFARLFLVPPMSWYEQALVWLMVAIVCVIGFTVYGQYEVLR